MSVRTLADFHKGLAIDRRGEVVGREDYLDYMTFRRNIKPLFTEIFGPLLGLKEEWAAQGATPKELDLSAYHFRFVEEGSVPVSTGFFGGQEEQILEETDDHVIARDEMGRTVKLAKRAATLAIPMDWPVANMDDWRRIKPHYEFCEARFAKGWEATARDLLARGRVVTVRIPGGFDECRQLLGEEALCYAYYEQPELIEDILATITQTAVKVLDRVSAAVQVDQLFVHEDMAGKSGPMIGPDTIRQFVMPYYRAVWDMLKSRGARLFKQDSDGNMNPVIPAFLEAGLNLMFPLEPAAGMDPVAVREKFGQLLAIMGGIDKFALGRGREAIRKELEHKIPPLMAGGAVVLGLDHRIPNGTPLEGYRYYIQTAWEIIERESEKLGLK